MRLLYPIACVLLLTGCGRRTVVPEGYTRTTVAYNTLPGVPEDLLSADIYHMAESPALRPVVVWVHGGAWAIGDKAGQLTNKLNLFYEQGYVMVSVNYRLSPSPRELDNPDRVRYPDHSNDVADAVAWVYQHIGEYGGDRDRMVLLGHSAGAHLVALTGTSPLFLPARGLSLNTLRGVACFDTEGYDVWSQREEELYQNAFGTEESVLREASPITHVTEGVEYPHFFIAKRGNETRLGIANAFIEALEGAGATVQQVDGSEYDHAGINDAIGDAEDTTITPSLLAFFEACFGEE